MKHHQNTSSSTQKQKTSGAPFKMSLVADYGESDSSSEDSHNSNSSPARTDGDDDQEDDRVPAQAKLPTPDFLQSTSKTSVFSNPFKEAENAKQAILEKHVKMVNTQENVKTINGKKICWNYRKGRCRFGHNCIYAHDSDLQKNTSQLQMENETQQTVLCDEQLPPPIVANGEPSHKRKPVKGEKRKRPGLAQGLIPGKKVMKNYQKGKTFNH